MPTVIPYVPQRITVHLGAPSASADNVTVSFSDYVKNVASSEIYPTWEESALRANILAIVSFALNRVYTEFYRSRGYDFDITSSTAYDQFFVRGRSFFSNVSRLVDELFNSYLRRPGFVEPLAAKFCNGTTVTCEGLSQWGSQALAQQGYNSTQILRSYYGDVEIVANAPVQDYVSSYPGTPLRRGSVGPNVVVIQIELNRISQNYPAIPKVSVVDGIFGAATENSVTVFQEIFNLTPDGVVGPATWYALVRLYTAVTSLSELRSQGQRFYTIAWNKGRPLVPGDRGIQVEHLQYMLFHVKSADSPRTNHPAVYDWCIFDYNQSTSFCVHLIHCRMTVSYLPESSSSIIFNFSTSRISFFPVPFPPSSEYGLYKTVKLSYSSSVISPRATYSLPSENIIECITPSNALRRVFTSSTLT